MSFLFFNRNEDKFFVTIIILECDILGLFIRTSKSRNFLISCKKINHGLSQNGGLNIEKLKNFKKSLNKILRLIYQDVQGHFNKKRIKLNGVSILFSSPWFFSDHLHINLEGKNILVSREELEKEIKKKFSEITDAKNTNADENERKSKPWKLFLMEQTLNQIKLNGYSLKNPFDKRADNIEVTCSAISVFPEIQTVAEEEIKKFFKTDKVKNSSLPKVLSLCAFNNKLSLPAVFVFIDAGLTTVVEIWENGSYSSKVIYCGSADIIKTTADTFGVDNEDMAVSYLRLSKEKILSEDISSRTTKILGESIVDWQFQIKNAISDFKKGRELYSLVVICPSYLKNFFQNFLDGNFSVGTDFTGLEKLEEIISNPENLEL